MVFKKKKKNEPERSKFIEAPKVFISLGRTVNLGNFNSLKLDAGFSGTVGDTLTIMKELAVAIQENETVVDAYKRAFMMINEELDRQADFYRIPKTREWLDLINPNKPKPPSGPVTPALNEPEKPAKPASPQAGQPAKPTQTKTQSITERMAAETAKLKDRGNK